MDKTFEEIIGETLEEFTNSDNSQSEEFQETSNEEGTTSEEEYQNDEETPEQEEDDNVESEDLESSNEEVETPSMNTKDAEAFARMRTELKQANADLATAKDIVEFFDSRAKQMGYNDVQGLMEKTREAELAKQAEKEGIPVDVLKRISTLENKVREQDIEKEMLKQQQMEQSINHTFEKFMQEHSLDSKSVDTLAQDLLKDGFTLDSLMSMPSSAVTKILNSYLPNEVVKQEMIAKKEKIKKEVPPTGSTSSSNFDSEIDKIAKMFAKGY